MEKITKKKRKILKVIGGVCAFAGLTALAYLLTGKDENAEYTDNWFKSLSDEELDAQREVVRQAWCSCGDDMHKAVRLESLLNRFDNEMRDRLPEEVEYKPPRHREHGWYLDNDE